LEPLRGGLQAVSDGALPELPHDSHDSLILIRHTDHRTGKTAQQAPFSGTSADLLSSSQIYRSRQKRHTCSFGEMNINILDHYIKKVNKYFQ
jgi:hypothetical protein